MIRGCFGLRIGSQNEPNARRLPNAPGEVWPYVPEAESLRRDNALLADALTTLIDETTAPMWLRPDVYGAYVRATGQGPPPRTSSLSDDCATKDESKS